MTNLVLKKDKVDLSSKVDTEMKSTILCFPDVHGVLRGKAYTAAAFEDIRKKNSAVFTNLLLALDPLDTPITTFESFGIASGAADLIVRPDLSTTRSIPWQTGGEICFGDLYWSDGSECPLSTRGLLKKSLARLEEQGLRSLAAFEFEVRVFQGQYGAPAVDGLSYCVSALGPIQDLIDDLTRACDELNLGLSAVHTEGAPGLLEINLEPAIGVVAADNAVLLRLTLKELARQRGLHVSFMSKPIAGEEGSSGHLHCSLLNGDGRNVFAGPDSPDPLSGLMKQAIAGVVQYLPAMSVLYNPTINSFKRLVPGFFAPVNAAWGVDNRSAAVRVILPEDPKGTRIELRRPGADVNPYLGLAGLITSICLGIEGKLTPPEPVGRTDASSLKEGAFSRLPCSLEEAVGLFNADSVAQGALGVEFSKYFSSTRKWELLAWQQSVSEWERGRYVQIT